MKTHILALFAILAAATPRAAALPPTSRTMQGEVTAVEREHQRFTVRTVRTPGGVTLAWGPRTRFVRGAGFATATELKRGQQVTIRCRAPFFGPKVASRVFVLSDTK